MNLRQKASSSYLRTVLGGCKMENEAMTSGDEYNVAYTSKNLFNMKKYMRSSFIIFNL